MPYDPLQMIEAMLPGGVRVLAMMCVTSLGSCVDPVHAQQVQDLGPEDPAVAPGPLHRPGQPCTVCHSTEGPASSIFTVAGTVFDSPEGPGAPGVEVRMDDSKRSSLANLGKLTTNCAGNFFVRPFQWTPIFPIIVAIQSSGRTRAMQGHVSREGSCSACHKTRAFVDSAGRIQLSDLKREAAPLPQRCQDGEVLP